MAEEKKYFSEAAMARDGEFMREYGKQFFIVVHESLGIGRVKFEIVPMNNAGKDALSFYLRTEQMYTLCMEITTGKFAKKLAADTGAYPSAYKYVTGTDGHVRMSIGGGQRGCRIQIQNTKEKKNYMIAVAMESIETMAVKYRMMTGAMPVMENTYYASIVQAFERGRAARAHIRANIPADDIADTNSQVLDEKVVSEESAKKADKATEQKKAEKVGAKKVEPTEPVLNGYTVSVSGKCVDSGGFIRFAAKVGNPEWNKEQLEKYGKNVTLLFKKEDIKNLSWFESFANSVAFAPATLNIVGEMKNDFILFYRVQKKK